MNEGFEELLEELQSYIHKVDTPEKILAIGAEEFVKDLSKLSKPKSNFTSKSYTHLVNTFSYQKSNYKKQEIEVGWGKYYGPFVEKGTRLMNKQPHLQPTFEKNKEKYYNLMISKIFD